MGIHDAFSFPGNSGGPILSFNNQSNQIENISKNDEGPVLTLHRQITGSGKINDTIYVSLLGINYRHYEGANNVLETDEKGKILISGKDPVINGVALENLGLSSFVPGVVVLRFLDEVKESLLVHKK